LAIKENSLYETFKLNIEFKGLSQPNELICSVENDFNIIKAHYDTGHLTIEEYTTLLEILMEQCIRNKDVYEEGIEEIASIIQGKLGFRNIF
jgi:hypothetical protein